MTGIADRPIDEYKDGEHLCFTSFTEKYAFQHLQSPGSTGRLLQGSLAITPTGLAPASKWQLARHTKTLFYLPGQLPLAAFLSIAKGISLWVVQEDSNSAERLIYRRMFS